MLLSGIVRHMPRNIAITESVLEPVIGLLAPANTNASVLDRSMEIARDVRRHLELGAPLPQVEKDILDDIFHEGVRAENRCRDAGELERVEPSELLERTLVVRPQTREERRVSLLM